MDKTSHAAGLNHRRWVCAATAITVAAVLCPLPTLAFQRQVPVARMPRTKEIADALKGCFITDPNGRKWPCSRRNNPAANLTLFECPIENRLGADMLLYCPDEVLDDFVGAGETAYKLYHSVFDPAPPPPVPYTVNRTSSQVSCEWWCTGNKMSGVVVWDERWPEAWSCRAGGGGGACRLVFDSNREVALVTRAGRRVLGDLAIKDCSKNWGGFSGWLPFGLGCTYPKRDHEYYGTIG